MRLADRVVEIRAAGAVVWRPAGEVALVHRPRYDDWSLPKGKLDPGETVWAAAVREVGEETGFTATLGRRLGRVRYPLAKARPTDKVVDFFAAVAGSGRFQPNNEVDQLRWVPPAEAENMVSYQGDRDILRAFRSLPANPVRLLLVRHAVAGDRATWTGPDDLRPLTAWGWRQTAALRALLPLFGVDRLYSAPLVRCVQTVRDLAADLGTPVVREPLLSERAYLADRADALVRLRRIATAGGTPAVCSQGGVIPHLLASLAEDAPVRLDNPSSAKGSVWVLSFSPTPALRLVAADYIPHPVAD